MHVHFSTHWTSEQGPVCTMHLPPSRKVHSTHPTHITIRTHINSKNDWARFSFNLWRLHNILKPFKKLHELNWSFIWILVAVSSWHFSQINSILGQSNYPINARLKFSSKRPFNRPLALTAQNAKFTFPCDTKKVSIKTFKREGSVHQEVSNFLSWKW